MAANAQQERIHTCPKSILRAYFFNQTHLPGRLRINGLSRKDHFFGPGRSNGSHQSGKVFIALYQPQFCRRDTQLGIQAGDSEIAT